MNDETDSIQKVIPDHVKEAVETMRKTAVMAQADLGEYGEELAADLENLAQAVQETFEIDASVMDEFRTAVTAAKETLCKSMEITGQDDLDHAHGIAYLLCDQLEDPKQIMRYVRTANEMLHAWKIG